MSRTIPRAAIDEYTRQINTLSESMGSKLADELEKIDLSDPASLDAVRDLMQLYCGVSTDASALLAAQYYDAARMYSIGEELGASAVSQRDPLATSIAVDSIMQGNNSDSIYTQLLNRMNYEIKRAAGDCVFYNGAHDPKKPMYARVPSGAETCDFCLILASRGFAYKSEKSAGGLDHYHAHCDCRVVPGWDGQKVEGYDPDELYEQYLEIVERKAQRRAEKADTSTASEQRKIEDRLEEAANSNKERTKAVLNGTA